MTIVAGFTCCDGVLLCADSQYSTWDRLHRDKIFVKMCGVANIAFATYGDADYAKTAIDDIHEDALRIPTKEQTIWTIRKAARRAVKRVLADYDTQKHLDPSQRPAFLVGINGPSQVGGPCGVRLFSSNDTAFSSIDSFDCRGTGSSIGNYVIGNNLHHCNMLNMYMLLPLAVKAVAAAKRNDNYSGGGFQFVSMSATAVSAIAGYDADELDKLAREFDEWATFVFCRLGESRLNDNDFKNTLAFFGEKMQGLRSSFTTPGSSYRALADTLGLTDWTKAD